MSRYWLFLLAGIFFGVAIVCAYHAVPKRPEQLRIEPPVRDLGELSQQQTVETEFELTNDYPFPIKIQNVYESCGCSVVNILKGELNPGEKTQLKVKWKTGSHRGQSAVQVQISYSFPEIPDQQAKMTTLGIEGNIIPDINYEPKDLEFNSDSKTIKTIHFLPGKLKTL